MEPGLHEVELTGRVEEEVEDAIATEMEPRIPQIGTAFHQPVELPNSRNTVVKPTTGVTRAAAGT